MGTPAAVLGDKVTGVCATHLVPNPTSGVPQPSPPLPFSAPLTLGCVATVLIAGKPAAVVGSSGQNLPPHVGLHPSDPFLAPPAQQGKVVQGSPTVLVGGMPLARTGSNALCCPPNTGTVVGTAATVLVA